VDRDQSSPQFVAAASELRDTLLNRVRPLLQFTARVVASGEDFGGGGGGGGGTGGGLQQQQPQQQQQQQPLVVAASSSWSSPSSAVSVEAAEEATHALALLFVALCSGENLERLCSIQPATTAAQQQEADLELIATVLHMLTNHPCRRIALLTQVGGLSFFNFHFSYYYFFVSPLILFLFFLFTFFHLLPTPTTTPMPPTTS